MRPSVPRVLGGLLAGLGILAGAVLAAAPATAAEPTRIACDDGSPGGIGGHTADSQCATFIQELTAAGCTYTESDEPGGPEDTLTADCSAAAPDRTEFQDLGNPAVQRVQGALTKATQARKVVDRYARTFTCTGSGLALDAASARTQAVDDCEAALVGLTNAWSAGTYDAYVASPLYRDVLVSTRCGTAEFNGQVKQVAGLVLAATAGTMRCTLLVWAAPAF
jgi:hypothetical protein